MTFCILWGGSRGASASPRHRAAGAPTHLLAGWGARAPPGGAEMPSPPSPCGLTAAHLQPALGSGLVMEISPWPSSPGTGRIRTKPPSHPQQLARQLTGFRRSTWTSEDPPLQPGKGRFPRASPPVSHRPSHVVISYGSFQTQSRRSLIQLLG